VSQHASGTALGFCRIRIGRDGRPWKAAIWVHRRVPGGAPVQVAVMPLVMTAIANPTVNDVSKGFRTPAEPTNTRVQPVSNMRGETPVNNDSRKGTVYQIFQSSAEVRVCPPMAGKLSLTAKTGVRVP